MLIAQLHFTCRYLSPGKMLLETLDALSLHPIVDTI